METYYFFAVNLLQKKLFFLLRKKLVSIRNLLNREQQRRKVENAVGIDKNVKWAENNTVPENDSVAFVLNFEASEAEAKFKKSFCCFIKITAAERMEKQHHSNGCDL